MNSYFRTSTIEQTGLESLPPEEAVYQEQVRLLYQHLPYGFLSVIIIAPVFAFIIWDEKQSQSLTIWLSLMFLLTSIRFGSIWKFNRTSLQDTNIRKWEKYFLAGLSFSAILWGSTCILINEQSSNLQQLFQIFIVTGLVSGSIAHLSARSTAFRIFLILALLPYVIRYLMLDTEYHLAIASLICLYIMLMLPISMRISQVINESLQLRYRNTALLKSCKEANQLNIKANKALFDVMKKNKTKELELEKNEVFLRSILATANDGIITSDENGLIQAVNYAIERDFGYTEQELLGHSINLIMADDMGHKHDHYIKQYLNSDMPTLLGRMLDVTGKRKDGSLFPMEITVSVARIEGNVYFTGIIRDTTERKDHEKTIHDMMKELAQAKLELEDANSRLQYKNRELTDLSEHDALTGLANRRFLMNTLQREWSRHKRNKKYISVVLLDVDFFKRFNDSYGHQAGDGCLKEIADTLVKHIARPADFIARYGGEEFIVVLPETDLDGAYYLAENMRHAIALLQIEHAGSEIDKYVTLSGGAASMLPSQDNSVELLINEADKALYQAKHSGRNRIQTA